MHSIEAKHRVDLEIPIETWMRLVELAKSEGMPMSSYVIQVCNEAVAAQKALQGKGELTLSASGQDDVMKLTWKIAEQKASLGRKYDILKTIQDKAPEIPSEIRLPRSLGEIDALKHALESFFVTHNGGVLVHRKFLNFSQKDLQSYIGLLQLMLEREILRRDLRELEALPIERQRLVLRIQDLLQNKLKLAVQIGQPTTYSEAFSAVDELDEMLSGLGESIVELQLKDQVQAELKGLAALIVEREAEKQKTASLTANYREA